MILQALQVVGIILFVLIFFGLCIFVHEFGHFIVALWRGLYIERFSIGFGKKIWGFTKGNVEFVVSVLPFGGYVALPQLEPAEVPESESGKKLPRARPVDRLLTAFSGPFFNVLFAIFVSLFVWWLGVYRPAHNESLDVISVPNDSPEYQSGLRPGDEIIKVNDEAIERGWAEVSERITLSAGEVTLTVRRDGTRETITYKPAPNPDAENLGYPFFRVRTPTVVHRVLKGRPAAEAGFQSGDEVLRVNGEQVANQREFIEIINQSQGAPLEVTVRRDGTRKTIEVRAQPQQAGDDTVYRIGAVLDAPQELVHLNPWEQFLEVFQRTAGTLYSLFSPKSLVKPRHMSGPIGIVGVLWAKLAAGGFREGLSFVILLSYSLAFFNLLPIPVLDGGHMLFSLVEIVIRRPLPVRLMHIVQNVFAILIISLMLYITFFDIQRVPRFFRAIYGTLQTEEEDGAASEQEKESPSGKPASKPSRKAPAPATPQKP